MILGAVLANHFYNCLIIFSDGSWGLFSSSSGYGRIYYTTTTTTLSYIGLIIGVLLFTAYVVCTLLLKEDKAFKVNTDKNANTANEEIRSIKPRAEQKSDNITQAKDIADALKQYKELLDSGIITQAEFDEKKKWILEH